MSMSPLRSLALLLSRSMWCSIAGIRWASPLLFSRNMWRFAGLCWALKSLLLEQLQLLPLQLPLLVQLLNLDLHLLGKYLGLEMSDPARDFFISFSWCWWWWKHLGRPKDLVYLEEHLDLLQRVLCSCMAESHCRHDNVQSMTPRQKWAWAKNDALTLKISICFNLYNMLKHICLLLQYGSPNCAALLRPKTFEADTLTVKKDLKASSTSARLTHTHTHTQS